MKKSRTQMGSPNAKTLGGPTSSRYGATVKLAEAAEATAKALKKAEGMKMAQAGMSYDKRLKDDTYVSVNPVKQSAQGLGSQGQG
jgi:hypothetical protein